MPMTTDADKTTRPCYLILGAAGFIGSELRRQLASSCKLICVDIRSMPPLNDASDSSSANDEVELTCDLGDLEQIDALWEKLSQWQIEGVVYLAAYYDFANAPNTRYQRLLAGLEHIVKHIKELEKPIPFIYASSMAALSPTEPGVRQTPASARSEAWAYPSSKVRAEAFLEGAQLPMPVVELVIAAVYSDWCELVPLYQHIERARRGGMENWFYPAELERGLTYVHVQETARGIAKSLNAFENKPAGVYRLLLGERQPTTYGQITESMAEHLGTWPRKPIRIPKLVARLGAWWLDHLATLRHQQRFLKPWMIDFAGEHFEFDLTETEQMLNWAPRGWLHDALPEILSRARHERATWTAKNHARPWQPQQG